MSGGIAGLLLDWACVRERVRACPKAEKHLSALRPEKSWSFIGGRGFDSRHLHHLCVSHWLSVHVKAGPHQGPGLHVMGGF